MTTENLSNNLIEDGSSHYNDSAHTQYIKRVNFLNAVYYGNAHLYIQLYLFGQRIVYEEKTKKQKTRKENTQGKKAKNPGSHLLGVKKKKTKKIHVDRM